MVVCNVYKILSNLQEGVEEELDADANKEDDIVDPLLADGEDKQEQEPTERARKTSKYMTKYERARILGTRALQIRYCVYRFVVY